MGVREIISFGQANYNVAASTQFLAGAVVSLDTSTGLLRLANRGNSLTSPSGVGDTRAQYRGIACDSSSRNNNTQVFVDPVGATYLDTTNSNAFTGEANGLFPATKRALADWQAEDVNGITNLVDDVNGFAGPRRGIAVYTTSSTMLVTDQFALYQTSATNGTYLDAALSSNFAPNDLLTFGSGANAGLLVRLTASTDGPQIARVDSYDSVRGLLYIMMI